MRADVAKAIEDLEKGVTEERVEEVSADGEQSEEGETNHDSARISKAGPSNQGPASDDESEYGSGGNGSSPSVDGMDLSS